MGWSNSQFDGTLVIPTDATTGARIVLNGDTGQIEIFDSGNHLLVIIDQTGYQLFNASGQLVAQITLDAGQSLGGFYVRGFQFPENVFAFLSGGQLTSGPVDNGVAAVNGFLQYLIAPAGIYTVQTLSTGLIDMTLDDEARLQLISQRGQLSRAWIDGGSSSLPCELAVTSSLLLGDSDLTQPLIYQGRGFKDYQAITSNTTGTNATELTAITSANTPFYDQRAYRVTVKGFVQSSVAADVVRCRVLKTNLAGQGIIDTFQGLQIITAGTQTPFYFSNIIKNVSGATVTKQLILTYRREVGTGSVFIGASAANPAYMQIEDIGPASYYPNANAIT